MRILSLLLILSVLATSQAYAGVEFGVQEFDDGVGDGFLGFDDASAGTWAACGANVFYYNLCPADQVGKVAYGYVYHQYHANNSATIGVYETDGTLLAYKNINFGVENGPEWQAMGEFTEITLVDGRNYIVGAVSNDSGGWRVFYDSKTGSTRKQSTMTYATTLSNHDFSSDAAGTANSAWCIYVDNGQV